MQLNDTVNVARSWWMVTPHDPGAIAMLNGFCWALSLIYGEPVLHYRELISGPANSDTDSHASAVAPIGSLEPVPFAMRGDDTWVGGTIVRGPKPPVIADLDAPLGEARAFTTSVGVDGVRRVHELAGPYGDPGGGGMLPMAANGETDPP